MAQPDAALFVNEIAHELFSMTDFENLHKRDRFTRLRLEKNIAKVIEPSKRVFLSGVLQMIYGDVATGLELCERAIQLDPSDPIMWSNYCTITRRVCSLLSSYDIRLRGLKYINHPNFTFETLVVQQQLNQFKAGLATVEALGKLIGREEAYKLCNEQSHFTIESMRELSEMPQAQAVQDVTRLMFSLAEEEHNYKVRASVGELEEDGDSYCIEMFIPDIDLDELKVLNSQLLRKRREQELTTSQVVGLFREGPDMVNSADIEGKPFVC